MPDASHPGALHPRLTVNPVSLSSRKTLADYLATLDRLGATRAGVGRPRMVAEGWDESVARLDAASVDIVYLSYNVMFHLDQPETWSQSNAELRAAIDAGSRFSWGIYGVTGPGPAVGLSWEQSTEAFLRAVAPAAEYARARGVALMLEPSLPLFADIHYLHTLRDTVDVAEAAGLGVCFEINASWMERDLQKTIERAGSLLGLVQLSDCVPLWRSANRAIPGAGVVPLEQVIEWILATGYEGSFDIELWGDSGVEETEAVLRSADHLGAILERLGA